MVTSNTDKFFEKMRSRIRRLPRLTEDALLATTKKDALILIETFQDGVRKANFGLDPLQFITIQTKEKQGLRRPRTPLYGSGDEETNSYINSLRLRRLRTGWKVFVSWAKHHSANLTLRQLFFVHENGAIIKRNNTLIRIPPRPAFFKAYRRFLRKRRKGEDIKQVRDAINSLLRTGSDKEFRAIIAEGRKVSDSEKGS